MESWYLPWHRFLQRIHISKNILMLQGKMTDGPGWKQVLRIQSTRMKRVKSVPAKIGTIFTIMIAPGQTVAIPFRFLTQKVPKTISIDVILLDLDTRPDSASETSDWNFHSVERTWGQVYKFTMEGYDTAVQYAFVKPPRVDCLGFTNKKCPVIVALHGAGVKVSGQSMVRCYRTTRSRFGYLTPSGRTPWGF